MVHVMLSSSRRIVRRQRNGGKDITVGRVCDTNAHSWVYYVGRGSAAHRGCVSSGGRRGPHPGRLPHLPPPPAGPPPAAPGSTRYDGNLPPCGRIEAIAIPFANPCRLTREQD